MPDLALPPSAARRLYDRLGRFYEFASFFEGRPKELALRRLSLTSGLRVLDLGSGTGRDLEALKRAVQPGGQAVGLDISGRMARLARRAGAPMIQADARRVPLAPSSLDRAFASYVFDLLPASDHQPILHQLHTILRPGGILVVLALTEGVSPPSRFVVGLWKRLFELNPALCGGCRPLQLRDAFDQAGFSVTEREVVVQLGVPSEIVVGEVR